MSLSGRASPRATDPISRTWVAPCAAATRRIAARRSRIVSFMATPATKIASLSGVYRRVRAETRPALTLHCQGNIVPDEPLDLPSNQALVIRIESINGNTLAEESALTWIAENSYEGPRLPSDLSHQHDHYLYGVPKKDL
jgi:hypothetical protein